MHRKNQQSIGLSLDKSIWEYLSKKAADMGITRHKLTADILKEYVTKNPPEQLRELIWGILFRYLNRKLRYHGLDD